MNTQVAYGRVDRDSDYQLFTTRDIALANLVVMLRAYFDDSGKFNDPQETAVVVAGGIAEVEQWVGFDLEWKRTLDKFNVSEFHMSHLAHFKGEYTGWAENKRKGFLRALCQIVDKYIRKPIGGLVPKDAFQSLSPERRAQWMNDPYFVCLQDAMRLAGNMAHELFVPAESVHIICDQQPGFEAKANRVYRACQKQLEHGDRLVQFGFGDSKDYPGLQLADLIAYEALHVVRDILDPKKNEIDNMRWPMTQLFKKQVDFEFHSLESLKHYEPTDFSSEIIDSHS